MSNLRKAAEELIEAWDWDCSEPRNKVLRDLIEDIRQALSQPEQEPLVWMNKYGHVSSEQTEEYNAPLYTAPPKREWVGLTRRELDIATLGLEDLSDCYQAIEAKLKEKNT